MTLLGESEIQTIVYCKENGITASIIPSKQGLARAIAGSCTRATADRHRPRISGFTAMKGSIRSPFVPCVVGRYRSQGLPAIGQGFKSASVIRARWNFLHPKRTSPRKLRMSFNTAQHGTSASSWGRMDFPRFREQSTRTMVNRAESCRNRTSGYSVQGPEPDRAPLAKMRTAIGVQECAESALIRRWFVRTAHGYLCLWELAFLLTTPRNACPGPSACPVRRRD
jgi:hypothetical protein